ncbi:hypothetical protein GGI08_001019 [Coemansia sp. S2]|nr:hypothetical protein GGI08_001019 [Coemansia sp. S2]KAJ2350811.1 hypothetical protein GGH92_002172 [Coemansia sp. RSA 2673]
MDADRGICALFDKINKVIKYGDDDDDDDFETVDAYVVYLNSDLVIGLFETSGSIDELNNIDPDDAFVVYYSGGQIIHDIPDEVRTGLEDEAADCGDLYTPIYAKCAESTKYNNFVEQFKSFIGTRR